MSGTVTRHHPWCHEHVEDTSYTDSGVLVEGFCQSRELHAGDFRVTLAAAGDERPMVEIIGSNRGPEPRDRAR